MKCWIGVALFSLSLCDSFSLKDRRRVVRSLLDRVKKHYNTSAADLGPDSSWREADVAVSGVGSSFHEMEQRMNQVGAFMERAEAGGEFEIMSARQEVFSYGDI